MDLRQVNAKLICQKKENCPVDIPLNDVVNCICCLAVRFICENPDIKAISFVGSDRAVSISVSF